MASDPSATTIKSNNLKLVKKVLVEPSKFREQDFTGKACFSYNYKKYGCLDTWDLALNLLGNLPPTENLFNELIIDGMKVKPYLDVEWMKSDQPDLHEDDVRFELKDKIVEIFKKDFNYELKSTDILFAKSHRPKNTSFKYSFHVIINTQPNIVFLNTNYASALATKLKSVVKFDKYLIDSSVYKKTQNIRLIGHCKLGENVAFQGEDGVDPLNYIITNIGDDHIVLQSNEQKDLLYKCIKNVKKVDFTNNPDDFKQILEKIKIIHPSVEFER